MNLVFQTLSFENIVSCNLSFWYFFKHRSVEHGKTFWNRLLLFRSLKELFDVNFSTAEHMVASYFCSLVISNLVCSLFPLSYLRLSLATLLQIGASSNELKPRFHGLNECTTKSYLKTLLWWWTNNETYWDGFHFAIILQFLWAPFLNYQPSPIWRSYSAKKKWLPAVYTGSMSEGWEYYR